MRAIIIIICFLLMSVLYIVWPTYTTIGIYVIDQSNGNGSSIHLFYPVEQQIAFHALQCIWQLPSFARIPFETICDKTKKYPLMVISHGYKGDAFELFWLIERLVHAGYLVASIEHSERSSHNNPLYAAEPWRRAQAISEGLSTILESEFSGCIDHNNIGFVGHSMGGLTGLWLAGAIAHAISLDKIKECMIEQLNNTQLLVTGSLFMQKQIREIIPYIDQISLKRVRASYEDERIKAFFLISPVFGWLFGIDGFSCIRVPLKIVAFEHDPLVLAKKYLEPYIQQNRMIELTYVISEQDNHFAFLQKTMVLSHFFLPKFVWEDLEGVDREIIQFDVAQQALSFFNAVFITD